MLLATQLRRENFFEVSKGLCRQQKVSIFPMFLWLFDLGHNSPQTA
jgi:hypothetical protein